MIVVLISIIIDNPFKFRIVNSISCAMFVTYGLLIGAYPVVIMKGIIIFIHLYKLIKK